tara:strand:- start:36 stop:575 length:540 start_codon:yes stop_codon:yes gene_type:complete
LSQHKDNAKKIEKAPRSHLLFADGATVSITLVENIPDCNDKYELQARERWHIENNECVNKQVPGRTQKEWEEANKEYIAQQRKEYYQDHKEHIAEQTKEYREEHKEERREKSKEKITCECGAMVRRANILRHRKTDKHKNKMLEINNTNVSSANIQNEIQSEAQAAIEPVEQPEGYSSS